MPNVMEPIRITLVAPTNIGKTTIVATVLRDLEEALPARFAVEMTRGKKTVEEHNSALDDSIIGRQFVVVPELGLSGTGETTPFEYKVHYNSQIKYNHQFQEFHFMDYPGGYITGDYDEGKKAQYDKFLNHLTDSVALWIPVDATLVMHAHYRDEDQKAKESLAISQVADKVRTWARHRVGKDAILCFVPIKCETYLSQASNAEYPQKLELGIRDFYKGIINDVRKTIPQCDIYYTPIESMGCVKLISVKWPPIGSKEFPAEAFAIVSPFVRRISGVKDLTFGIYSYAAKQMWKNRSRLTKLHDRFFRKELQALQALMEGLAGKFGESGIYARKL
jgi:hypothetical protein